MQAYQHDFIKYALVQGVLRFGEFTLKSGRISPYFFNSGLFNNGEQLWKLGQFYAQAIQHSGLEYDMLFGPAYKGIPLVSAVAIVLSQEHHKTVPYSFDRKEAKDHGEGGLTVGAPLQGNVLIIDDVITAGTSVRYSVDLIRAQNAVPIAAAIALDRQERGEGELSAVHEVEQKHAMRVINIINLENLIEYLQNNGEMSEDLKAINNYREKYGIN